MANLTTIQIKKTITGGAIPTNLLANGEIALNLTDKRIFTTNTTGGAVFDAFQNTSSNIAILGTTVQLSVGNSTINLVSNSSILKLQNSTVSSSISIANVVTTNVYASFLASGNIAAASQLGSGTANSTTFLRGDLTFAVPTASATAGGANTQVQFNDSTAIGGDAGFTYNKTIDTVSVVNSTSNVVITPLTVFIGNSTANSLSNSIASVIANSTTNSSLTPALLTIGNSTSYGSFSNTTMLIASNSTVNSIITDASIRVQNSTANAILSPIALSFSFGNTSFGDIAVPPANTVALFGKYKASRIMPTAIDATNIVGYSFMPHQGHTPTGWLAPTPGGTGISAFRMTSANTIAFTARTPASGNTFLSAYRVSQTTGVTAGTSISWRNSILQWWRGNAAGLGGFYAVARFGVAGVTTNGRLFVGLKDSATILANGNPSAQTNIIGFSSDSGGANLFAISANATVANTIDLGAGFVRNVGNTDYYEAVIYAPPNGGTCQYQITNLKNGNTVTGAYNQTNLPSTTTFLTWHFWGNNGSDAAAFIMDWGGVTMETLL